MDIAVIGTGYVGLVTGACLADSGHRVICYDKNRQKIGMLQAGKLPFFEPGLEALIARGQGRGTLAFKPFLGADAGLEQADVVFLTIGTPSREDGRADLASLLECAEQLAATLTRDAIIAVKSTVPVGTCEYIQGLFDHPVALAAERTCVVASNPEFLAESRAVLDFQHPERIVIGCDEPRACDILRALYKPFDPQGDRTLVMSLRSAEFAKYACNATLAARISMVNELACIAGSLDVDMRAVCRVLKTDPRIGPHYLEPGAGYGGSCLPKDIRALMAMARDQGEPATLLHGVEVVNAAQAQRLFDTVVARLGGTSDRRCVALWGLAFKAGTDDLRESPSLVLARQLLKAGLRIQAYDPVAGPAARALIPDLGFELHTDLYSACEGADLLVVMTDWEEFRAVDFSRVARSLSSALVLDGREIYDAERLRQQGLTHLDVGQCRLHHDSFSVPSRGTA